MYRIKSFYQYSLLAAGTYYVVSEGYGAGVGSIITTIKTTSLVCNTVLNLTVFIEGYYAGAGTMVPVMVNEGYAGSPLPTINDVDDILVEVRNSVSPFGVIASTTTRLKTNGTAVCNFGTLIGNYYIVVKHRNGMQTWSKNPVSFSSGSVNYNFSTAATQAYGDNMKNLGSNIWGIYSGDIFQDENIDLLDLSDLQNDITNFLRGYRQPISTEMATLIYWTCR